MAHDADNSPAGSRPASASHAEDRSAHIRRQLELGRALLKNREAQAAAVAFQTVTLLDPKHAGALSGLAAAFNQQNDTEAALTTIRCAVNMAPKSAGLHMQLGHILNKRWEWADAAIAFQTALDLDPTIAGAHSALAIARENQGKTQDPILAVRAAIKTAPTDVQLHVQLGQLLLTKGRNQRTAMDAFQTALAIDPTHPGALAGLASALKQQGNFVAAIDVMRRATSVWPQNPGLGARLGQLLEEHRQMAEAERVFRQVLAIDPGNAGAQAGLRRIRDPGRIFSLFQRASENSNDLAIVDALGAELNIPRVAVAGLIRFALNPTEASIDSLAHTSLDKHLLRAAVRADRRQTFARLHAVTAPAERIQVASPETDSLAGLASHETWTPIQWLSSFVLRKATAAHRAAVVVTMRDEGIYVLEWVAHYRALGFDAIFIYSNENVDGSEGLLCELAGHGIITYFDNQLAPDLPHSPQKKAYAHALHLVPELWEYEWVLFADADEFLVPDATYGLKIHALIDDATRRYPARAPSAICFHWFWHVSGFAYAYSPTLLLRRFQHGEGKRAMKSMVRLRDVYSMHRIHFPEIGPEGFLAKSDFTVLEMASRWMKLDPPVFASGRLNHYWNKSFEEFSVKKARGDIASERDKFWKREFALFFTTNADETRDNHAPPPAALIEAVEAEMQKLASLPGVERQVAEIHRRWPLLLARFDGAGGLRSIYETTLEAMSERFRPVAARVGGQAMIPRAHL